MMNKLMLILIAVLYLLTPLRVRGSENSCLSSMRWFVEGRYRPSNHLAVYVNDPVISFVPEKGSVEDLFPGVAKKIARVLLNFPPLQWSRLIPPGPKDFNSFIRERFRAIEDLEKIRNETSSQVLSSLLSQVESSLEKDLQRIANSYSDSNSAGENIEILVDASRRFSSHINDLIAAVHFSGEKIFLNKNLDEIEKMISSGTAVFNLSKNDRVGELDIFIYSPSTKSRIIEVKSNRMRLTKEEYNMIFQKASLLSRDRLAKMYGESLREPTDLDLIVREKTIK